MRTIVGVLRGGPSSEYEVSLKSGASVLKELDSDKYEPRDIFISKDGEWHKHGIVVKPAQALTGVDVVFNALHGEYGEDGTVQRLLDTLKIPYTGSDAVASAIAFNKLHTKDALKLSGIKMARHVLLERDRDMNERKLLELFRTFPHPSVIKPLNAGSSVGVTLATDFYSLAYGLDKAFEIWPKVLVEEYIKGREATCGIIDDFRGQNPYSLLPIEIIPPPKNKFFDYEAKYNGGTKEICPGNFSTHEKAELQRLSKLVHEKLNLRHYSRSDFIVSPRGIYFLEVNTLPGMTEHSLLPKAIKAVGASLRDFLDHVIELARK